jgi:hypothetical protein
MGLFRFFYDGKSIKKNEELDVAGRDISSASGRSRRIVVRDASPLAELYASSTSVTLEPCSVTRLLLDYKTDIKPQIKSLRLFPEAGAFCSYLETGLKFHECRRISGKNGHGGMCCFWSRSRFQLQYCGTCCVTGSRALRQRQPT